MPPTRYYHWWIDDPPFDGQDPYLRPPIAETTPANPIAGPSTANPSIEAPPNMDPPWDRAFINGNIALTVRRPPLLGAPMPPPGQPPVLPAYYPSCIVLGSAPPPPPPPPQDPTPSGIPFPRCPACIARHLCCIHSQAQAAAAPQAGRIWCPCLQEPPESVPAHVPAPCASHSHHSTVNVNVYGLPEGSYTASTSGSGHGRQIRGDRDTDFGPCRCHPQEFRGGGRGYGDSSRWCGNCRQARDRDRECERDREWERSREWERERERQRYRNSDDRWF